MATAGYIPTREAKKALGVNETTLRSWADGGLIPSIRTPKGTRLYNIAQYLSEQQAKRVGGTTDLEDKTKQQQEKEKERIKICYCRVSSQGQKDDLQRQVESMQQQFPSYRIVTDIGSGINFKRKGLRDILELSTKGMVSEVVVAYRDRLCRFAFELFEWLFQLHGVRLVVLNKSLEGSEQGELAEDLLAIINVFNCRVNGKRKYNKKGQDSKGEEKQGVDEE